MKKPYIYFYIILFFLIIYSCIFYISYISNSQKDLDLISNSNYEFSNTDFFWPTPRIS